MQTTKVVLSATGQEFTAPGALTASEVVSMYGSEIQGLASMNSSVSTDPEGNVTITFSPRTGNKG